MARARNIKPSIMTNDELACLPPLSRLLFIYLWMLADRAGRIEDKPKKIAAQALPYDRDADVDSMLSDLQSSGFIKRYEANGIKCIQIVSFAKHQNPHVREIESELPEEGDSKALPRQCQGSDDEQPKTEPARLIPDSLIPDSLNPIHPTDGADAPALDQLFSRGIEILTTRGVDKKNVRAFLGLMRKRVGDVKAMELLLMVDEQDISAPIAWLTKVMDNRKTNHEYKSQRDKVADTGFALTGSYRPTERVIEGTATAVS